MLILVEMFFKSKIKWAMLLGIVLSTVSLLVHLLLANSSGDLVPKPGTGFNQDYPQKVGKQTSHYRKLWGSMRSLEDLQPYANPRGSYPVPSEQNNGFIYAKIYGGFESIRSSICDLVAISRLLNVTLVIPEIQESTQSKGISNKFKSFSYLYNEEQFIAALTNDIIVVKSLPELFKEARRKNKFLTFKPKHSEPPSFYISEILPTLKRMKAIGLVITNGGCLQSILPPNMDEYQRLRCRVAFHALHFRPEIMELGHRIVERLRSQGQPYLAFHTGLVRDTLAYHGCAEVFQDVHTELIQYRRAQMIKQGIIHEELSIDSHMQRRNGSCPLMPEEVGLLLRAMGYPPNTIIYLAGAETFGGQRVLIPLRALYPNLVDHTSLCSKKELLDIIGPETSLPLGPPWSLPVISEDQQIKEWKIAGPRPRPLPPPPARPTYRHEKEGWYGWIAETDTEPDPSAMELRMQAHRLLWDALDYVVSVEADAFFPGFNNDGSKWPDFSSLVMGHRLYEMASARTYRPDRKILAQLFDEIRDHMYYPKRNWTVSVRKHLNGSSSEEGLIKESLLSKPGLFLSHPLPECSCRTTKMPARSTPVRNSDGRLLYGGEEECPEWMQSGHSMVSSRETAVEEEAIDDGETLENDSDLSNQPDSVDRSPSEQDEEMDPDD